MKTGWLVTLGVCGLISIATMAGCGGPRQATSSDKAAADASVESMPADLVTGAPSDGKTTAP
jgi:hypothetical protein